MTTRPARAADIMRIIEVAEEIHQKGRLRDAGAIHHGVAQKLFARSVFRHGDTTPGSTYFVVSERKGRIEGYFLGMVDRAYQIGNKLVAMDIHLCMTERADARDTSKIIDGFVRWAQENEDVVEIYMSWSDIAGTDHRRYEKLLKRKGFVSSSHGYGKTVPAQCASAPRRQYEET